MLTSRAAYRLSLAAGLIILSLAVLGQLFKPVPVCGNLAANYTPIIAFEMARSVTDLQAIFGDSASECRRAIANSMDNINWIDCLFYIPIYGAFVFFFCWAMRERNQHLASVAAWLTVIACASDYVENFALFQLSAMPEASSNWLTLLAWSTEVKWVGLGAVCAIGGYILWNRGGAWRLAVAPCSLGLAAALISIYSPAVAGPYLSPALAAGWIIFLYVDAQETLRTR